MDQRAEQGGGPRRPASPSTAPRAAVTTPSGSLAAVAAGVSPAPVEGPAAPGGAGRVAGPGVEPRSVPPAPEDCPPRPDLLPVDEMRRSLASRTGLFAAATGCFAVGLLLWPVPVATGLPFHVAGLLFLGMASRRVARSINRWERRLPDRCSRPLRRVVASLRARFHRARPESDGEGAA